MENVNFKWLVNDIYNSIIIKLVCKDNGENIFCGTYEVLSVLDTVGDKLDIEFANIDDMTKLLTLGMVRFVSVQNNDDIIDVPFRNLYKLYQNSNSLHDSEQIDKRINLSLIDAFSVFDGAVIGEDYYISACLISEVSDDLRILMETANGFGDLGMQEKFDALSNVNMINYRRVQSDSKQ